MNSGKFIYNYIQVVVGTGINRFGLAPLTQAGVQVRKFSASTTYTLRQQWERVGWGEVGVGCKRATTLKILHARAIGN